VRDVHDSLKGSNYIAPQHVLLALLRDDSALGRVLNQWKALNVDGLPGVIRELRPMRVPVHKKPPLFPILNEYVHAAVSFALPTPYCSWATDLTQTILDKKNNSEPIDPLIGRVCIPRVSFSRLDS
jgi:hypothetical protein